MWKLNNNYIYKNIKYIKNYKTDTNHHINYGKYVNYKLILEKK